MSPIVKEHGLRAPLALIVTGANANWIDIPPIALWLWMSERITIDFRCGSLEDLGAEPHCQFEHMVRTYYIRFHRLQRVRLVLGRRGRARKIEDLIYLRLER